VSRSPTASSPSSDAWSRRLLDTADDDPSSPTRPLGAPLGGSKVTKRFQHACRHPGVRVVRFHDLRRTFATHCGERGRPGRSTAGRHLRRHRSTADLRNQAQTPATLAQRPQGTPDLSPLRRKGPRSACAMRIASLRSRGGCGPHEVWRVMLSASCSAEGGGTFEPGQRSQPASRRLRVRHQRGRSARRGLAPGLVAASSGEAGPRTLALHAVAESYRCAWCS